jgi:hypothetical protein
MYTSQNTSFLLNREYYLKFSPPESVFLPNRFSRLTVSIGSNLWFESQLLSPIPIPETYLFLRFRTLLRKIKDKYPEIFTEETKHLIITMDPTSIESKYSRKNAERRFGNLLGNIEKYGKYTKFLIMKLRLVTTSGDDKDFYIPEPFFEYMSGIIFRKKGYLVGKPIFPSSEDAGAYLYPSLISFLKENRIIEGNGAFFGEISLSEVKVSTNEIENIPIDKNVEFTYIEAESSPYNTKYKGFAEARIRKGEYHHKSFAAGPLTDKKEEDVGIVSFTKSGELIFHDSKKDYVHHEEDLQKILKNFVIGLLE